MNVDYNTSDHIDEHMLIQAVIAFCFPIMSSRKNQYKLISSNDDKMKHSDF